MTTPAPGLKKPYVFLEAQRFDAMALPTTWIHCCSRDSDYAGHAEEMRMIASEHSIAPGQPIRVQAFLAMGGEAKPFAAYVFQRTADEVVRLVGSYAQGFAPDLYPEDYLTCEIGPTEALAFSEALEGPAWESGKAASPEDEPDAEFLNRQAKLRLIAGTDGQYFIQMDEAEADKLRKLTTEALVRQARQHSAQLLIDRLEALLGSIKQAEGMTDGLPKGAPWKQSSAALSLIALHASAFTAAFVTWEVSQA